MSQHVTERVQRAIQELDYRPHPAARALATRRTFTLGLIYSRADQYDTLVRTAAYEQAARTRGYGLLIASTSRTERFDQAIDRAGGIEGIISDLSASGLIDPHSLGDLPFVGYSEHPTKEHRQAVIALGQADGARRATQHLLELGHSTVAHLGGPLSSPGARHRRRGWTEALHNRASPEPPSFRGDWSARSGYRIGRQLLHDHPGVTAVFVANDEMAVGILRAAAEQAVVVPRQVSVVGMGDIPLAAYQPIPLSTMSVNPVDLAERAVSTVTRLIEGHSPADNVAVINYQLVHRATSSPPA